MTQILTLLKSLYDDQTATETHTQLQILLNQYRPQLPDPTTYTLTPQDAILITYGDMVQQEGQPPLATLNQFLQETITDTISTVHLLPFYPYTSDDGFSVVDFE